MHPIICTWTLELLRFSHQLLRLEVSVQFNVNKAIKLGNPGGAAGEDSIKSDVIVCKLCITSQRNHSCVSQCVCVCLAEAKWPEHSSITPDTS